MPGSLLVRLTPLLFVLIWATGFVVARLVAPYAEPLTFLTVRFAAAAAILAVAARMFRAAWPPGGRGWRDALVAGVLLHGIYLGCVFWAIRNGLPAGISALIVGTQPLLTALFAGATLGETVGLRRWTGIGLGLAGIALVLAPRLGGTAPYPPATLWVSALGVLAVTAGTIWQKRFGGRLDLRSGTAVQFMGAAAVTLVMALLLERGEVVPAPAFWLGLLWAVFGLSIGAIALLLLMLRRGGVVGVASLMFLVPPVSALMSYGLFGETLQPLQLAGMGLAAFGVALASRS